MQNPIHSRFLPTPYQDSAESGRLILRDGSTAFVRLAGAEDNQALIAFFGRCSSETMRRRFFSVSRPCSDVVASLCDNSESQSALTLVVTRTREGEPCIVATGSYFSKDERTAEVAFVVDDGMQGKGLGTLLLERLALLAARNGFTRFWAVTHADNKSMRDVFRESGFVVKESMEGGDIEVNLSVVPNETSVSRTEIRDRVSTVASLRPFFQPNSVAVVGASRNPSSIGFRILECLALNGFKGSIYPVNPNVTELRGLRTYPTVRELPESVDLAVIAVPRDAVLGVLDDCAARGVRAVITITAGFAEVNAEGRELQQRLTEKVRGHGMRMIGPNCLGLINTDPSISLNASFSPVFPPPGRIAMSSQSGALGLAVLAAAKRFGLGLSTFVSVGNKADVSGNDLLQYWEEDDATDVILLYLESFGNPRRFARIARRVSRRKPIVAIKSGRTKAGGRAAGSHTAALAASEVAVDALFRQSGVIRADTLEEMFDLAAALGSQPLPRGRRIAIITNAGGPAILCADACEAGGLVIPQFSAAIRSRLALSLPASSSTANPVDMIAAATPEQYGQVIDTLLASDEVDALIAIYVPAGQSKTEAFFKAIRTSVGKARAAGIVHTPVLACLMAEPGAWADPDLDGERIPIYGFPEAPARTLGKIAAYADWRASPEGSIPDFEDLDLQSARATCQRALALRGTGWLTVDETRTVLAGVGQELPPGGVARTAQEAVEIATQIGFPVAVKLASHELVHKTELGGVRLNLTDADAVRIAFDEIRNRLEGENQLHAMDGVLVQPMISGGVEVMMGATQDPLFGPLIAFGLGGVYVEILADVSFRVTPLTDRDAAEMVRSIRGYRLLQGYRGHPPANVEDIEEILLRLSRLVEEIPEISEVDLNPVIAMPPGEICRIVDARIRVESLPGKAV
jgi:acetate---CoA ligase (ADP-forming)